MSGVAGAIAGAAVLGAGATIYASSQASNATAQASQNAANVQMAALDQQKQLAQPYTQLGQAAIPTLENLLGIGKGGTAGVEQALQQTPGYQFTQQQGIDATKNAAAASGMALSGNTLEALDRFNTGLADQTYGEAIQRLLFPVQIGQGASAGQAANIQAGANNLGNIYQNAGATQAGIAANEAASLSSIGGNLAGQLTLANTLKGIQNPAPAAAPAAPFASPSYGSPYPASPTLDPTWSGGV